MIDLMFLAGAAVLALVLAAPDYQRALLRGDAEAIREDLKAIEQAVAKAADNLDVGPGERIAFAVYAPFLVGRPELVGTDEAYRRRGLVSAQFEMIHAKSAGRGGPVRACARRPSEGSRRASKSHPAWGTSRGAVRTTRRRGRSTRVRWG